MEIKFHPKFKNDLERMFSINPIYSVPRWFRDTRYTIRYAYQRVFRGYDDSMVWSFCEVFPDMMVKILTQLEKNRMSYPSSLTDKQWSKILNEMIDGFKAIDEKEYIEFKTSDEYLEKTKPFDKRIDRALKLFSKYFFNLWD